MGAVRKIACVAIAVLGLLSAPGPSAAEDRPPRPWWNAGWKYRLTVSIDIHGLAKETGEDEWAAFSRHETQPVTAWAEVYRANPEAAASQKDIRVIDADGNPVPCRVYYRGEPDTLMVLFPASRKGGEYDIYYGSSQLKQDEDTWLPATQSLTLTTLNLTTKLFPRTLEQIKDALRANPTLHGTAQLSHIRHSANPTKLAMGNSMYLTSIEGLFACERAGDYQFSIDAGGWGVLLIDNTFVTNGGGTQRPGNQWREPGTIKLKEGYHRFRLVLGEMGVYQGAQLGWMPPGSNAIELIPRYVYAKYVKTTPRRLSCLDGSQTVSFAMDASSIGVEIAGKTMVPVLLANISDVPKGGNVDFIWKINGTSELRGNRPKVPLDAGRTHSIRLEACRDGKLIGICERECKPVAQTVTKPQFRLEPISAPNIIFIGEQEDISFRVHSSAAGAMAMDWDCTVRRPKAAGTAAALEDKSGVLAAGSPTDVVLSIPLDTSFFEEEAEVMVRLCIAGVELASYRFRVVPLGLHIESLQPGIGCLLDASGTRTIIATHLVDQSGFRKWVVPKYIMRAVSSPRKKVLLYGCPMENQVSPGDEYTGYVERVRACCSGAAGFDFVKRSNSLTGLLADVPRFAGIIRNRQLEIVVVSPGLSDIMRGVEVRDFKRSVQVMIDLIRAKSKDAAIVLVSPPPLAGNTELSGLYRDAMEEAANENRTTFVDIHWLLEGSDVYRYYRSKLGDDVHYTNPNDEGQEIIAKAICNSLK